MQFGIWIHNEPWVVDVLGAYEKYFTNHFEDEKQRDFYVVRS